MTYFPPKFLMEQASALVVLTYQTLSEVRHSLRFDLLHLYSHYQSHCCLPHCLLLFVLQP